MSLLTTSKTYN